MLFVCHVAKDLKRFKKPPLVSIFLLSYCLRNCTRLSGPQNQSQSKRNKFGIKIRASFFFFFLNFPKRVGATLSLLASCSPANHFYGTFHSLFNSLRIFDFNHWRERSFLMPGTRVEGNCPGYEYCSSWDPGI